MNWIFAKFVPRLLNDDLLQRANDDENLLKNVITSDETWIYGYEIETKQQSSHWKSPASPQETTTGALMSESRAAFFFYHRGIVRSEFASEDQIIKIVICWFRDVCGMWYGESDLKYGVQEAGFSIMIMRLLTQR
jgi:hypothetical protein